MFNQPNMQKYQRNIFDIKKMNIISENNDTYEYIVLKNIDKIIKGKNLEFRNNANTNKLYPIIQKIEFFNNEILRFIENPAVKKDENINRLIDFFQHTLSYQKSYDNILKLIISRFLYAIIKLISMKETYNIAIYLLEFIGQADRLCYAFFNIKDKATNYKNFYKNLYNIIVNEKTGEFVIKLGDRILFRGIEGQFSILNLFTSLSIRHTLQQVDELPNDSDENLDKIVVD